MRPGLFPLLVLSLSISFADPRAKPTDYPAHAESAHVSIGAEYLVHSFSNGRQTYFAPDFLVVDTAVYPHGSLVITPGHFHLRIDGKTFSPLAPGMVAYSLKSTGFDGGGQSAHSPRFPGDTTGSPPPPTPQAPDPSRPDTAPGPESAQDVVERTALPEGEFHSPQGGFLYFGFAGKLKKVKSMELVYMDDAGELTLPLLP